MNWITIGYHFVSGIVNCGIEHSAQIIQVCTDFAKCMAGKFFV